MTKFLLITCTSCSRRETLEFRDENHLANRGNRKDPLYLAPKRMEYKAQLPGDQSSHKAEGHTCICGWDQMQKPRADGSGGAWANVVAGAGLEPATFGL